MSDLELTPKQAEFAEAVFSGRYNYLLYGGAIRGGKTVAVLALIIVLCRVYPGSRWAVVRRDLPSLKRNVVPTFERLKPRPFVGDINRTDWNVKCANGSEILFFPESIKDDPDLDRWKGLEVNGFALEEANELSETSYNKAIERAGSWMCPGKEQPPPLVMLTCNPARNYVRRVFYEPWKLGKLEPPYYYLPARVTDNPHLSAAYLESIKNLPLPVYRRFVGGDWESADEPDQLIKFEWLLAARNVEHAGGKRGLGVDVARYGDDDTVILHREGNAIVAIEYHHGLSIDKVITLVQNRITDPDTPVDADRVMVDGVGLGAGVVDGLHKEGHKIIEVISGAKAIDRVDSFYRFNNLRSQMWWEFREALRLGQICIDVDDSRLLEDLTAPLYSISGDKVIKVESKDEIRKRIGRSTDAGDGAIYAWADLDDSGFVFDGSMRI